MVFDYLAYIDLLAFICSWDEGKKQQQLVPQNDIPPLSSPEPCLPSPTPASGVIATVATFHFLHTLWSVFQPSGFHIGCVHYL